MENQAIIALCTPRGSGAIALLRLSGHHALHIATDISKLPADKRITDVPTHTIHLGYVVDEEKQPIDQVMFLVMHGPRSFTGEHTVEITCHNNPFIIEAIIKQAIAHGARLAQEGEFCKRAVLNGKMDLVQAEAIHELIHAHNQMALKQSLAQVQGSFSHWIGRIEHDLIKAIAFCQASFEFIDEEHMTFDHEIAAIITNIKNTIAELKITFDQQQRIRQGVRIAIIGSVNAGKSSLFNHLLRQDRAIVTHIEGTTRDVIEAGLYKKQNYWTLIDTAGLRKTDDMIEQEGIARSIKEAELADIILLVIDASRIMHADEQVVYEHMLNQYADKVIVLYNKTDLPIKTSFAHSGISITTQTKEPNTAVEQAIEQKIHELLASISSPFLLNQRHFNLLLALEKKCDDILKLLSEHIAYELLAIELQDAAASLSELTGKSISEAAMDAVFQTFCVGK